MKFKIFYIIFLVVCLLYPFVYVAGPVAIRHILGLVMLIWLISIKEFKFDWVVKLYLIYLFFFLISSLITGHIMEFIPTLVGTYFLALVMYNATKAMALRFNAFNWIFITLLSIASIDAVVTIAQFFNHPIALAITDTLNITLVEEDIWDRYEHYGGALGLAAAGILGGVKNGYFLSATVILALYNKLSKLRITNLLLCLFLWVALFVSQERAAFYLGTVCIIFYILFKNRFTGKKYEFIFLAIIVVLIAGEGLFSSLFDISQMRYGLFENETGGREELASAVWRYLSENPFGGSYDFYSRGNRMPHNLVANSYLQGGIFGGSIVLFIVIAQIYICVKIIYQYLFKNKHSSLLFILALIYLDYTGNSAFHNLALCLGDEISFMWWAIIASVMTQQKQEIIRFRKNKLVSLDNSEALRTI